MEERRVRHAAHEPLRRAVRREREQQLVAHVEVVKRAPHKRWLRARQGHPVPEGHRSGVRAHHVVLVARLCCVLGAVPVVGVSCACVLMSVGGFLVDWELWPLGDIRDAIVRFRVYR